MSLESHERLLALLRERYPNAIIDGPVSCNYWTATKRILWVLRETHDSLPKFKNDLRRLLLACAEDPDPNKNVYRNWKSTYGLVAKCSYGLLHHGWIDNVEGIRSVLREIAVINIDKRPGGRTSLFEKLKDAQREFGDIIKGQITSLDPEIIILGNVAEFLPEPIVIKEKWVCYTCEGRKWINVYHPQQSVAGMTHAKYYNLIIEGINKPNP